MRGNWAGLPEPVVRLTVLDLELIERASFHVTTALGKFAYDELPGRGCRSVARFGRQRNLGLATAVNRQSSATQLPKSESSICFACDLV